MSSHKNAVCRCRIYERRLESGKVVVEVFDTDENPYEEARDIVGYDFRLKKTLRQTCVLHLRDEVRRAESEIELPWPSVTRLFNSAFEDPEIFFEKVIFVGPYPIEHIAEACLRQ